MMLTNTEMCVDIDALDALTWVSYMGTNMHLRMQADRQTYENK